MKIKHFTGYGSINATKLYNTKIGEKTKRLVIKVSGNHECGLVRRDYYDVFNCLVKRFDKNCTDYKNIDHIIINSDYENINNIDTEIAIYTIDYIL